MTPRVMYHDISESTETQEFAALEVHWTYLLLCLQPAKPVAGVRKCMMYVATLYQKKAIKPLCHEICAVLKCLDATTNVFH